MNDIFRRCQMRHWVQVAPALVLVNLFVAMSPANGQVRVTPDNAKGGVQFGPAWEGIPDGFRVQAPEWPIPTDLKRWQTDRLKTRGTLLELLGDMPARPDPAKVRIVSREDRGEFLLERFEFHNGADMLVPGILAIPKGTTGSIPVVIGMHGHSGSKNEYLPNPENELSLGWMLVKRGFAVAAIDSYFNGERVGHGPRGRLEKDAAGQEMSLFKLHLWLGRTSWGMMIRDEQCLIDYLQTRPELDSQRIGATGMSMGCTRAWWTAALDERIKAVVGVACFTRYTELLAHASSHGIYYFVPGVLKHFDTEAIYALVAPRPMLQLSGDQDRNAPPDGVEVLEQKVLPVYRLYGREADFVSVLYKNTGHEYLPDMRHRMATWFEERLKPNP